MSSYLLGEMIWKLKANSTSAVGEIKKTDTAAKGLGASFTSAANVIKGFFATAAVVGIAKVSKELINAASEAEETTNKFDVTFSTISDAANAAAENLSESFGLSSQKSKQLLSDTGDLLTGFGFTQDSALDLSNQVNELAVDLASFTNYSGGAEGASAALTSGLLGEREAMKSLGIAITEADIKQLAEDKGIEGELDRQTKAMLTLELAVSQSKNAIGDFARSEESFANQSRIAEAAVADLKVAMGEALLPTATKLTGVFIELTNALTKYVETAKTAKSVTRDLMDGVLDEERSLEDLQLALEKLEKLNRSASGQGRFTDEIKALKALIEAYGVQDAWLQKEEGSKEAILRLDEEQKAAAIAAIEAEQAAREQATKELRAYLDLVEEEFGKTTEGQIEALEKEISMWEKYAETADKTLPAIQAIIKAKKEELEGLKEKNEEEDEELTKIEALQKAYDKELELLEKRNELGLLTEEEYNDNRLALEKEYIDKLLQVDDTSLEGYQEFLDDRLDLLDEYQDDAVDKWKEFANAVGEIETVFTTVYDSAYSVFSAIGNLISQLTENQIEALEEEKDALLESLGLQEEAEENQYTESREQAQQELEDLRDDLRAATTIEERSDALKAIAEKQAEIDELAELEAQEEQKLAIEEAYAKKEAQLEYENELYAWKLNLIAATASAAQAILTAISTAGNIYAGIAMASLAGTVGAINVATVAASKPTPPSYAVGSWEIPEDQTANVHEGEMIIPKTFADSLRENISGESDSIFTGGTVVNLEIYTTESVETEEETSDDGTDTYRVFVGMGKKAFQTGEFDSVITQRFTTTKRGIRG